MATPEEEALAREKSIHNETIKYQSTFYNTLAAGVLVAGVATPIASAVRVEGAPPPATLMIGVASIVIATLLRICVGLQLGLLK